MYLAVYLAVEPFHTRYSASFLKRMHFDAGLVHDGLKLLVDVIQHLAVHLQGLNNLLMGVVQRQLSKVTRNLSPRRICTPTMWRAKEDD
jgi:hypothetical protein